MMIRADLVFISFFILLIVFMIREMRIKLKYINNPTDFDSGYDQAIDDVVKEFNDGARQQLSNYELIGKMKTFLLSKSKGRWKDDKNQMH